MTDNEKIPAEDWTFVGKSLRRLALFSDRNGTADAQAALADIAEQKAKEAREREERERRGWKCSCGCGVLVGVGPAPIPNPSAADVRELLEAYGPSETFDEYENARRRVLRAMIRDFAERKGIK